MVPHTASSVTTAPSCGRLSRVPEPSIATRCRLTTNSTFKRALPPEPPGWEDDELTKYLEHACLEYAAYAVHAAAGVRSERNSPATRGGLIAGLVEKGRMGMRPFSCRGQQRGKHYR